MTDDDYSKPPPPPITLPPPPPPSITIVRDGGFPAWTATITDGYFDYPTVFAFTEAGCERKARRCLTRVLRRAARRAASRRTITLEDR